MVYRTYLPEWKRLQEISRDDPEWIPAIHAYRAAEVRANNEEAAARERDAQASRNATAPAPRSEKEVVVISDDEDEVIMTPGAAAVCCDVQPEESGLSLSTPPSAQAADDRTTEHQDRLFEQAHRHCPSLSTPAFDGNHTANHSPGLPRMNDGPYKAINAGIPLPTSGGLPERYLQQIAAGLVPHPHAKNIEPGVTFANSALSSPSVAMPSSPNVDIPNPYTLAHLELNFRRLSPEARPPLTSSDHLSSALGHDSGLAFFNPSTEPPHVSPHILSNVSGPLSDCVLHQNSDIVKAQGGSLTYTAQDSVSAHAQNGLPANKQLPKRADFHHVDFFPLDVPGSQPKQILQDAGQTPLVDDATQKEHPPIAAKSVADDEDQCQQDRMPVSLLDDDQSRAGEYREQHTSRSMEKTSLESLSPGVVTVKKMNGDANMDDVSVVSTELEGASAALEALGREHKKMEDVPVVSGELKPGSSNVQDQQAGLVDVDIFGSEGEESSRSASKATVQDVSAAPIEGVIGTAPRVENESEDEIVRLSPAIASQASSPERRAPARPRSSHLQDRNTGSSTDEDELAAFEHEGETKQMDGITFDKSVMMGDSNIEGWKRREEREVVLGEIQEGSGDEDHTAMKAQSSAKRKRQSEETVDMAGRRHSRRIVQQQKQEKLDEQDRIFEGQARDKQTAPPCRRPGRPKKADTVRTIPVPFAPSPESARKLRSTQSRLTFKQPFLAGQDSRCVNLGRSRDAGRVNDSGSEEEEEGDERAEERKETPIQGSRPRGRPVGSTKAKAKGSAKRTEDASELPPRTTKSRGKAALADDTFQASQAFSPPVPDESQTPPNQPEPHPQAPSISASHLRSSEFSFTEATEISHPRYKTFFQILGKLNVDGGFFDDEDPPSVDVVIIRVNAHSSDWSDTFDRGEAMAALKIMHDMNHVYVTPGGEVYVSCS